MKYLVTVDRGVYVENVHYPVLEQVDLDATEEVQALVERGFLTPMGSEPKAPAKDTTKEEE